MNTNTLTKHWDRLSADELRHLQGLKLGRYLADHVIPFSKHYRELFAKEGLDPRGIRTIEDLAKIPFTSKRHLVDDPETGSRTKDFVLVPDEAVLRKRPATILRALCRGRAKVKAGFEHEYRPILLTSTTGRSTEPVPFLYTAHDLDVLSITGRRMMEICESDPAFRHLNLFPFAPHLAFWQAHHAGLGYGTSCSRAAEARSWEPRATCASSEDPARRDHRDAHLSLPSPHPRGGARALRAESPQDRPRRGKRCRRGRDASCAPSVPNSARARSTLMATYGFTEAKMAWPECPGHGMDTPPGYHLSPDLGIVEIIDPETGLTVGEGEAGEIVFTRSTAAAASSCVTAPATASRAGSCTHPVPPAAGRCRASSARSRGSPT